MNAAAQTWNTRFSGDSYLSGTETHEHGGTKKYVGNRLKIDVDALAALQRLFAGKSQVRGRRRGSVDAILNTARGRSPGSRSAIR